MLHFYDTNAHATIATHTMLNSMDEKNVLITTSPYYTLLKF